MRDLHVTQDEPLLLRTLKRQCLITQELIPFKLVNVTDLVHLCLKVSLYGGA